MFPCNIQIMIDLSPEDLDLGARDLRTRMFCMINELSRRFDQDYMDSLILVDLDMANAIVGIDFRPLVKNQSEVVKLYSVCKVKYPVRHPVARTVTLGDMTMDSWITMRF